MCTREHRAVVGHQIQPVGWHSVEIIILRVQKVPRRQWPVAGAYGERMQRKRIQHKQTIKICANRHRLIIIIVVVIKRLVGAINLFSKRGATHRRERRRQQTIWYFHVQFFNALSFCRHEIAHSYRSRTARSQAESGSAKTKMMHAHRGNVILVVFLCAATTTAFFRNARQSFSSKTFILCRRETTTHESRESNAQRRIENIDIQNAARSRTHRNKQNEKMNSENSFSVGGFDAMFYFRCTIFLFFSSSSSTSFSSVKYFSCIYIDCIHSCMFLFFFFSCDSSADGEWKKVNTKPV